MKKILLESYMILLLAGFITGCRKDDNKDSSGGVCQGPSCVSFGTAANYVILAKTGVSAIPDSIVTGNIELNPVTKSSLNACLEISDVTNTYSTSAHVSASGKIYAADYDSDNIAVDLTATVSDKESAHNYTAGLTFPDFIEPGAGNIYGMILVPDLGKLSTGVIVPANIILSLDPSDAWIFQIAGYYINVNTRTIVLVRGKDLSWHVTGSTGKTSAGTGMTFRIAKHY